MPTESQTAPERLFKSDFAQFAWDAGASNAAFMFENIYTVQRAYRRIKKWLTRQ